jgi:hypothetical protein
MTQDLITVSFHATLFLAVRLLEAGRFGVGNSRLKQGRRLNLGARILFEVRKEQLSVNYFTME